MMRTFASSARSTSPSSAAAPRAQAAPVAPRSHRLAGFTTHPRSLSQPERSFFEPKLGTSLADVRVHEGPRAATAAASIGARAFTKGRDVVLGEGGGADKQRLLAHELVHVAQGTEQRDESIRGRAEANMVHRDPCRSTVRDKGGAGQLLTQSWFFRNDPGGGEWFREFEVPHGSLTGDTGFADLVWDSPGGDVYVYEMKKDAAGGAAAQAQEYRDKIAYYCKGRTDNIFQNQTIRMGTQAALTTAGVPLELPYLSNDRYIDLTVPTNGVMVYQYKTLASVAGGTDVAGMTAAQRETFRTTVEGNIMGQLVPATLANATLATAVPAGASAAATNANAANLWKFLLRNA